MLKTCMLLCCSQQELCGGMERNCYCCRPGPSLPNPAPSPSLLMMDPSHSSSRPAMQNPPCSFQPRTDVMDVDLALSELDSLRCATGSAPPAVPGCSGGQDQRPERKARARSLSESMASASRRPAKSHSETSLYRPLEAEPRGGHYRRTCAMGSKMIGCSLSLPRKIGSYQMVQRNSAFVSDISGARSPLQHSSSLPAQWVMGGDSGVGSYSEQSSSKSSSPSSMGSYRDSDLLEERSRQRRLSRQKLSRMSRFRLDRTRRLRQPYSIPFRMCQSMSEDSTSSLNDFLSDTGSKVSKSTTASPIKPDMEAGAAGGTTSGIGSLVRSHSIDNLELARLRLTDVFNAKSTDSIAPQSADVEQVSTDLKNLQMV